MNFLKTIGGRVNDHANAVMVKELRQAVQSRVVIALLMLFLAVDVLIISGYLSLSHDVQSSQRAGRDLFYTLLGFLAGTCMFFVPISAALRLSMERNHSNIDLFFITTISPGAIIRGKFWAALALTALLYSACLPFMTMTYMLRGIELPAIFFTLLISFLLTSVVIMMGLFAGSVQAGMFLRMVLGGLLLQAAGSAISMVMGVAVSSVDFGLSGMFTDIESWLVLGFFLLLGASILALFYLLAVAAVSAPSSNRMMPTRIFLTLSWLVYGGVSGLAVWIQSEIWPMMIWVIGTIVALCVFLPLMLAERENWTPRVRKSIPRSFLPRFFCWLFYTGAAGGVLWCALLFGMTFLVGFTVVTYAEFIPRSGSFGALMGDEILLETLRGCAIAFLYTWCYTLSGLFVRRMLFPRSAPLVGTVTAFVLLGLMGVIPLIAAYFIQGTHYRLETLPLVYVVANPMVMVGRLDEAETWVQTMNFLAVWGVLIFLVNLPWFRMQWQRFTRYEPKAVPAPDAVPAEAVVANG